MNLIDCYVTEILSEPYQKFNTWWVNVKYDAYGSISETQIMCSTKEDALNVKIGYKFLA